MDDLCQHKNTVDSKQKIKYVMDMQIGMGMAEKKLVFLLQS